MWDKRLVAIKKGKRLGTTLLAHSFKPDFAAVRLLLEKVTRPITNKTNVAGRIYFFIEKTAKRVLAFLEEVLMLTKTTPLNKI